MANKNKTMCNCEGFYNEEQNICEPLQANSPDPCPSTFWGNLGSWLSTNVTIGGYGGGGATNYYGTPPNQTKDNALMYVLIGVVVIGIIYFVVKKK